MDTDRNLLFGVLALQAGLIDAPQFIEACLLWTTRKKEYLGDLLLGRGWIEPADKSHVEYLLERKLRKHGGNAHASLAALPDDIKRSLTALLDDDIQRSLAGGPLPAESQLATIDHVPEQSERYCRLHLHATGGIGRVWLAHDSDLGRDIALKELRRSAPRTPRSGRAFSRKRRSPASSNIPASSRCTNWSAPRWPATVLHHALRQGSHLEHSRARLPRQAFGGSGPCARAAGAAECLRHGLQYRGLCALARGHSPRPQGPERDPGRFRRSRRAGLGFGQAGGPAGR